MVSWRLPESQEHSCTSVSNMDCTSVSNMDVLKLKGSPVTAASPLRHKHTADDARLKMINGGCYRNGPNSSPVLTWKPTRSSGRYCIRLRRVFTSAASSARVCLFR